MRTRRVKPIGAEPNNQAAAGTGTELIDPGEPIPLMSLAATKAPFTTEVLKANRSIV